MSYSLINRSCLAITVLVIAFCILHNALFDLRRTVCSLAIVNLFSVHRTISLDCLWYQMFWLLPFGIYPFSFFYTLVCSLCSSGFGSSILYYCCICIYYFLLTSGRGTYQEMRQSTALTFHSRECWFQIYEKSNEEITWNNRQTVRIAMRCDAMQSNRIHAVLV